MGRGRGRRYQADLRFPDEEPSEEEMEFIDDDEEIDEDTAFTAEDYIKYGDIGNKRSVRARSVLCVFLLHQCTDRTCLICL